MSYATVTSRVQGQGHDQAQEQGANRAYNPALWHCHHPHIITGTLIPIVTLSATLTLTEKGISSTRSTVCVVFPGSQVSSAWVRARVKVSISISVSVGVSVNRIT